MSDTTGTGNPYRIYRITWVVLLMITVAMLAAEAFHLPRWFLIVFLTCFMMVKAVMIAGNFMHLRFERPSLAVVVASGILVTSLILFSFISREAHHVARSLSN